MPEENEKTKDGSTQQETGQVETEPQKKDKNEGPEEELKSAGGGGIGNLLSPEGLIFFPLAFLIDLIGVALIMFGADDFGITDIIGTSTIGVWLFLRTGMTPEKPQREKRKGLAKLFRGGKGKKLLIPLIGEIIPYIGVLPFWTLGVWYALTD